MLQVVLNTLLGCSHRKTTFPLTTQRKTEAYTRRSTYVVCGRCGAEFAYDWHSMRIQKVLHKRPPAPDLGASLGECRSTLIRRRRNGISRISIIV